MRSCKDVKICHDEDLYQDATQPGLTESPGFPPKEIHSSEYTYPLKENRYVPFGWNAAYQYCYRDEEVLLIQHILTEFEALKEKEDHRHFFLTVTDKFWRDWWTCIKPAYTDMSRSIETQSFTLPNREAKDATAFPLWHFADNLARKIANWQKLRIKNQKIDVMNDPVMLIFEELKIWLLNAVSEIDAKKDSIEVLAKRQSYLKNIIHLIPHFGPDRLYLHEIQQQLQEASHIIIGAIANKELPQLLSDTIVAGKGLETTLGTYLHFLLINEEVTDNFSYDYLEQGAEHCHLTPLCKVYKMLSEIKCSGTDNHLIKYEEPHPFHQLIKLPDQNGLVKVKLELRKELVSTIKFASFVNDKDKVIYLEAIALLQSLMNVRKTFEKFQHVQSRIGTYMFASHYLETANSLASNYIRLISKAKNILNSLLSCADNGFKQILSEQRKQQNQYFERNFRALQTRVAKGTTESIQFDRYCAIAIDNTNKYQQEMKKLVSQINSGEASQEIEHAMQDLFMQMRTLNTVFPALLGEDYVIIDEAPKHLVKREIKLPMSEDVLPKIVMREVGPINQTCEERQVEPVHAYIQPPQTSAASRPQHFITNLFNFHTHDQNDEALEVKKVNATALNTAFNNGRWDSTLKYDKHTGKPIFTYRVFLDDSEVGSAEFYAHPLLCLSEDKKRHNLIHTNGVLSQFKITDEMSIPEICSVLPPTLFDKVLSTSIQAAQHGCISVGSNIVGVTLHSLGVPKSFANYMRQFTYWGCFFWMRYSNYYDQMKLYNEATGYLDAMYYAARDTGQLWLTHYALNRFNQLLSYTGDSLKQYHWQRLGSLFKKIGALTHFGVFAYKAADEGVVETVTALLTGAAVEQGGQYLTNKLIN